MSDHNDPEPNGSTRHRTEDDLFPRHLSPEEIDNPILVLDKFFDIAKLPQAREFLWEMLRAIVTGDYVKMKIQERSNMLFIYEQLQRMVEANYLIHAAGKSGSR